MDTSRLNLGLLEVVSRLKLSITRLDTQIFSQNPCHNHRYTNPKYPTIGYMDL